MRRDGGCVDACLLDPKPRAPKLAHPREVDEPVVDAVADDDGAEEGGLGVEVADDEAGQAEWGERIARVLRDAQRAFQIS